MKRLTLTGAGLRLCEAVHAPLPCGGRGRCGSCAVFARGALSPVSPEEAALLRKYTAPPPEGFARRLACFCTLEGEAEVLLPEEEVYARPIALGDLPAYDGDAPGGYGLAVDIGTTAITLAAYRLPEGREPAAVITEMNRQSAYGADVITRIGGDHALLHRCVTAQLAAMLARAGIAPEDVRRAVITGNTAMLHLFAGLDPAGMGRAPFTPQSLFGHAAPCDFLPRAEVYLPPCASAFVGADITCGALAADLLGRDGPSFLIDVGTNGEMMLRAGGRLLCCSTAAGPAFEGAEISQGMPALPGAVDRVWLSGGEICWRGIPGAPVRGICGTGMVSALRAFYERGDLDETGAIAPQEGGPCLLRVGEAVALTQRDVRKLQLVKAAVAAGIAVLLQEAGIQAGDIARTWLAGGFGSALDPLDAAAIGMIPAGLAPQAKAGGNLALRGAAMLLFSEKLRAQAQRLARESEEIPLATHPVFQEEFVEQMGFPAIE